VNKVCTLQPTFKKELRWLHSSSPSSLALRELCLLHLHHSYAPCAARFHVYPILDCSSHLNLLGSRRPRSLFWQAFFFSSNLLTFAISIGGIHFLASACLEDTPPFPPNLVALHVPLPPCPIVSLDFIGLKVLLALTNHLMRLQIHLPGVCKHE
jgi:hypothetical protein